MRTTSLDLRERILAAYDNAEGTRAEMAHRFRVSLGLVKKLLQQRRRTGQIAPRHRFSGRKPMIVATHRGQLRSLLAKKNDLTLKELRQAAGLKCSLQAIHVVLGKMELTYKKRRSAPASKTGQTLRGRGSAGGNGRRV
jgi:transposase